MSFMILLIFLGFLNARDIEALRDHLLAIRERVDQALGILTSDRGPGAPSPRETRPDIPPGAWEGDPATPKQIAILEKGKVDIWDGISKGEASKLIKDLFNRRAQAGGGS